MVSCNVIYKQGVPATQSDYEIYKMDRHELAEDILQIYNAIREGALEDPEIPEEEIGLPLTIDQVLYGIELSDIDETEAMVDSLYNMEDEEDEEVMGGIFYDWLQDYVFQPLADQAIGQMVDKGYLECTGMDSDGEFVFRPTAKGREAEDWNIDDFS